MAPVDSFRFCSRGGLWGRGRSPRSLGPARGRPSGRFRCYARSCGLGWRRRHRAGLPGRGERLRYVKDAGGPRGEPGLCAGLCAAGPALRCARPAVSSGQVPWEERGGAGRDLPGAGRGAARLPFRSVLRPDRASAASRRCFPEGGGRLNSVVWAALLSRRCFPHSGTWFLVAEGENCCAVEEHLGGMAPQQSFWGKLVTCAVLLKAESRGWQPGHTCGGWCQQVAWWLEVISLWQENEYKWLDFTWQ